MDKLEKALQKARVERQQTLSPLAFGNKKAEDRVVSSSTLPESFVELSEVVLESNRIFAHHTRKPAADIFRLLRAQVLQAMSKHKFKTLAITSPNYGDGKTTIAINLCISIAQDLNQTVLLADLDLRKPSVSSYLGLKTTLGLTDYLLGTARVSDALIRLPFERMTVLPAGQKTDHSSETLGSPQMASLAMELKLRYPDRLVVYDMPPLLAQDDPLAFLPHVDAVMLVVRDGITRAADIKRSLTILEAANVVGVVLNDAYALKNQNA